MDEYEKRNQETREITAKIIGVFTGNCNVGIALSAMVMSIGVIVNEGVDAPSDKEKAINEVIANLHVLNKNMKEHYAKQV